MRSRLSDLPMGRRTSLLVLSAFAEGRHFVTLPALGLQVQLHQPPAQEIHRNQRRKST